MYKCNIYYLQMISKILLIKVITASIAKALNIKLYFEIISFHFTLSSF